MDLVGGCEPRIEVIVNMQTKVGDGWGVNQEGADGWV